MLAFIAVYTQDVASTRPAIPGARLSLETTSRRGSKKAGQLVVTPGSGEPKA